jgi:2-C-methyl-D-erythritol 4-phosphate cytidylyltransferase
MRDVAVIIPAGGKGRRMGGKTPKQFLPLCGKPILHHTIQRFNGIARVREIIVVVPSAHLRRAKSLVRRGAFHKVTAIVAGGAERQDSVRLGLAACSSDVRFVLVHDAVRPLVPAEIIGKVISAAQRYGAAVVAAPVNDTIKIESVTRPGFYSKTLPRHLLWGVQTPQGFRLDMLRKAHRKAVRTGFRGTDDASLVENMGLPVKIVVGTRENLKITSPADISLAEILLSAPRRGRR